MDFNKELIAMIAKWEKITLSNRIRFGIQKSKEIKANKKLEYE